MKARLRNSAAPCVCALDESAGRSLGLNLLATHGVAPFFAAVHETTTTCCSKLSQARLVEAALLDGYPMMRMDAGISCLIRHCQIGEPLTL